MPAMMSPGTADEALAQGLITPAQHAQITGAPVAPPPPAALPPPSIVPYLPPPDAPPSAPPPGLENAFGAAGLSLKAPPPRPMPPQEITSPEELRAALASGGVPMSGTTNSAVPERLPPTSSELARAAPVAPRGEIASLPPVVVHGAAPPRGGAPGGYASATPDPRALGLERDMALGAREEASAVRQGAEAEAQAKEAYAAQVRAQDAIERQAAIDAGNKAQEQAELDNQVKSTHAAVDDYSSQKVDPGRYWDSQSTPQKLLGLLGVAIGGFAEGYSGGAIKNPAMAAINRAIDQDIHAQEVAIETKKGAVQQKRSVLSDMIAITGSKEAGRTAAKVAAMQNLHQQLDTVAAKHAANVPAEKVEQVRIGIEQRLSDERGKLEAQLRAEKGAAAAHAAAAAAKRDDKLWGRGTELTKLDQEQQKINDARNKPTGGAAPANEDAAFRQDKAALDLAWENSKGTAYGSRPMAALGSLFATDNNSINAGATSQLVGTVKGQGDNSDKDLERLKTMVPQPGDDESTLNKKYGMLMAKLATKHPGAAERALRGGVKTTAAPSRE